MKKNDEVSVAKVEKIVINIGGKEVEYTLDEAKNLQKLLNNLFGTAELTVSPSVWIYPQTNIYPWIIKPYSSPYGTDGTVTINGSPIITCTYAT